MSYQGPLGNQSLDRGHGKAASPVTCDMAGCRNLATRVVHTDRRNTPPVVSYWCEDHQPCSPR